MHNFNFNLNGTFESSQEVEIFGWANYPGGFGKKN